MFCEKCGTQNPDGVKFCQNCGAAMPAEAPRPMQGGDVAHPAENPVRSFLRTMANGPLFLTGAIAYTVALLLQLVAAFMPGDGLGGTVYSVMNILPSDMLYYAEDFGISITDAANAAQSGSFTFTLLPTLFMMLPGILTAVAIWMIFAAVRDTTDKPISTVGFTMLKVLAIITLAVQAILLIVAEIGCGMLASFVDTYTTEGSAIPAFVLLMVAVGIGFALAILYNALLVRTLNAMAGTASALVPSGKVSVYVAVLCFIGTVFQLVAFVLTGGIFDKLNTLALMVSQVTFGILLLSYRSKMKTLQNGQLTH